MKRVELLPHVGEVRRPGGDANLDQGATDKVDAVIEPDRQKQHDRRDRQQERQGKPYLVPSHEVDFRRAPNDDQRSHFVFTYLRTSSCPGLTRASTQGVHGLGHGMDCGSSPEMTIYDGT